MTPRGVLLVGLATGFTTLVDQAVLTVAVPALRADLGAGRSEVQWILAAYSLSFGLALVPAGRLGDALGRERLLVGGLAVFSLMSLVGATAGSPEVLILARLLQGIGAGTANPQVIGLFQDHFTGPDRARALGAYATVGAVAATLAPVLGGGVLAVAGPGLGWRLVVALNLPFGLATVLFAARGLRSSPRRRVRLAALDPVGILLLTVLTLCVLLPVVGVGVGPAAGVPFWAAVAVVVTILLWLWEQRAAATPVLDPGLVRSPRFVLGTLVAMCWFGATLGSSVAVTLFLQDGLGLTPLRAGLLLLPSAVAGGTASLLAWRVVGRWGRTAVTASLAALAVIEVLTLVAVLVLSRAWLPAALAVGQVLAGAAGGLIASPNQALTLALAPPGTNGLAAGFFQVSQRIASTITLAACSGLVVAGLASAAHPRRGLVLALAVPLALVLIALVASVLEARRGRRPGPADVRSRTAPGPGPGRRRASAAGRRATRTA